MSFLYCADAVLHPIWKLNAFTCFVAFSWGMLGGKISGSRCVLRPGCVLEDMFWNIDIFTCVLVGSEFP